VLITLFSSLSKPYPAREQELKFHVPSAAVQGFSAWISQTLMPHPKHSSSTICSIYFDTPSLHSLKEKRESDFVKTKYRLRWYLDSTGNPAAGSPAFLEIKQKHGSGRRKWRRALSEPVTDILQRPLEDTWFTGLFSRNLPEGAPGVPATLRPVLELRYQRARYTHPVFTDSFCLDQHIRCQRLRHGLGATDPQPALNYAVFEQKGASPDALPVLRALPRFSAQRASLSKYAAILAQHIPDLEYQ
jgi:hypothetical protein